MNLTVLCIVILNTTFHVQNLTEIKANKLIFIKKNLKVIIRFLWRNNIMAFDIRYSNANS